NISHNLLNETSANGSLSGAFDKIMSDNDKPEIMSPISQKPSSPSLPSIKEKQKFDEPIDKDFVLEITDLVDPILHTTSEFTLKDKDNLSIAIY
ncbi:unnamed protein product, partial [Didymodactylos carnosus]